MTDGKLNMRYEVVEFNEDFPGDVKKELERKIIRTNQERTKEPMYVAENTSYSPELTIKGNKMKSIPTRGILASVRKEVVIEENIFDNMTMANIYLSNDADYWYESGPIRDMTIRNNKFYIRPTGQSEWGNVSGIFVDPVIVRPYGWTNEDGSKHDPADLLNFQVHKGIKILDNEFHMANDNVVTAEGVEDMEIRGNKIIRDNPDVKIELSTGKNNVEIGKPLALNTNVKENTLAKEVFKFTRSKNIIIEDNTYDDGFNMNITTSEMDEKEIKNGDSELAVNGKTNIVTAKSKLQFVSADPSVAYVNEYQEVVGLKDGETTDIIAYYEWNGTIYSSNVLTIQVGEVAGTELKISSDVVVLDEDKSVELTIEGNYDSIELLDPVTLKPTNIAKVEGTTYTALREGLVLVRVKNANATAAILMSNAFTNTYGSQAKFEDSITLDPNRTTDKLSGTDKYTLRIAGEPGDLYGGGVNVDNIVQHAIPEGLENDFRFQVTAKNLPKNGVGSYLNGGLMLFEDGNNYLSIGKKSHMQGLAMVDERKGVSTEIAGKSEDNALSDTILEISVIDGTATLKALRADGTWFTAGTFNVSDLNNPKIAVAAWNEGANPTFGDFKFAKGSEVTSEELVLESALPLFTAGEVNAAPTVSGVKLTGTTINKKTEVEYTYVDTDAEARTVFEWINSHDGIDDVTYTDSATYTPRYAGKLKVNIIPVDARGKVGQVVSSNEVEVSTAEVSDSSLSSLYVNGLEIEGFKSDKFDYEVFVPKSHRNLHITYDQADAGIVTEAVDSKGDTLATTTENNYLSVKVPEDGIVKVVRHNRARTNTTYTLKVNTIKNNDTSVSSITVNNHVLDTEIVAGSDSYFIELTDDENNVEIVVNGANKEQVLSTTRSFFEHDVANKGAQGSFKANVNLTVGLNAFYVNVLAADGISTRVVRVYVYRSGYNDASVNDITINGVTIKDFDPEVEDYILNITPEQAANFKLDVANKANKDQTTSISVNGETSQGTTAHLSFEGDKNTIVITNQAEDLWTNKYYTLNLIIDKADNANLLDLKINGETLEPGFSQDVTKYEVSTINPSVTLSATAEIAGAEVRIYTDTQYKKGLGKVQGTFEVYGDNTPVTVEVIGLDKKTVKKYVVDVSLEDLAHVSDMKFEATNGYLGVQLDKPHEGKKLSLKDENGDFKEFERGLGAHASSVITFDLEGKGYNKFETYIGIDKFVVDANKGEASVVFEVLVDGEVAYTSDVMGESTPMKFISIDLKDIQKTRQFSDGINNEIKEIKLVADQVDDNYSDHANWADAKFFIEKRVAPAVNKSDLESKIDAYKDLKAKDYTITSWEAFTAALKNAKTLLTNKNAIQMEVDEALEALELAFDSLLSVKEDIDTKSIEVLLAKADAIKNDDNKYTEVSFNKLRTTIAEVKTALPKVDTQVEVVALEEKLQAAIDGLEPTKEGELPTDPGKPVDPVDPNKPGPGNPGNPGNPDDSENPVNPVNPETGKGDNTGVPPTGINNPVGILLATIIIGASVLLLTKKKKIDYKEV